MAVQPYDSLSDGQLLSAPEWEALFDAAAAAGTAGAVASISAQVSALTASNAANTQAIAALAPIASPALTGAPTVPTPAFSAVANEIANAQFVRDVTGGTLSLSVTGNRTLSTVEAGGYANFVVAGATTGASLFLFPDGWAGRWTIQNNTNNALIPRMTAGGASVTIQPGRAQTVFSSGSAVYSAQNDFDSIAITGNSSVPTAPASDNSFKPASTQFVAVAISDESFARTQAITALSDSTAAGYTKAGYSTAQMTSQSYRPADNVGVLNLLSFNTGPQAGVVKVDAHVVVATALPSQCVHQIYINSNLLWSGGSSGSQSGTATAHIPANTTCTVQQVLSPGNSNGGTYTFVLTGVSVVFVSGGS
jgi:hypothetical protein